MNSNILFVVAGIVILLLGHELSFLFSASLAAFLAIRLAPLLPGSWPAWSGIAFVVVLAIIGAALTLINKQASYYICGFLAGGFFVNEFYAPGSQSIPVLLFIIGSILGAVLIGLLKDWGLIVISCMIGVYLLYGILPLVGMAKTLTSAGIFVVGGLAQVIIFQSQKHSER